MASEWAAVALAAINVAQIVLLAWINSRQRDLGHKLNGHLRDHLELARGDDAQRVPPLPRPPAA